MSDIPLKPNNVRFTDDQWEAVHKSGSNILISASAGSGKTTVLVERIIEHLKKGISIDELLVVTFTKSAAKEMKQRIQKEIEKTISDEPEAHLRHHLLQQFPKLGHANISTLHAFCLKVIQRYYYLIDFDPVFRQLTDETETELIKEEIWEELLEELYEEADPKFIRFMEAYASDRSDSSITRMVFQLQTFARANEDPISWLNSLTDLYDISTDYLADATIYQDYLKDQLVEEIEFICALIDEAFALVNVHLVDEEDEKILVKQRDILEPEKRYYERIRQYLVENRLDELDNLIGFRQGGYKFPTLSAPAKKDTPDEVLEEYYSKIKPLRDESKAAYEKFENHFALSPAEHIEIIKQTKEYVQVLAKLTKEFSQRFQDYKAERKLIDYNDLEHLTLEILKMSEEGAEPTASAYYRKQFAEVLVDEYQDINALQEAILLRLSAKPEDTGNYFMVGDVKQSIYSFRLADPSMFISKYNAYETGEVGQRIILAENFRSRNNILTFTNYIFKQLMDVKVGDIEYDKNAELVFGNQSFDDDASFDTEIMLYEANNKEGLPPAEDGKLEDTAQITETSDGEIMMVASRIVELMESGYEIYDPEVLKGGAMRPLQYKDIVLLTPTKKKNLKIQDIFQEAGIPISINNTENFFQTTEVTIMMSLLKIIDNPRQDIPLVATLRSPIVGLDEVDLTYIRIQDKYADYYDAMMSYAEADFKDKINIKLQAKIKKFIDQLNEWREYARRHSVVELLRKIYEETDYHHYVGGMSGGQQRKANLEALYERAAAYERTSFKGLYRFIRFIDKMQEKDKDLAEPTAGISDQDAVRVMTIHASKGLEFPLVFLMDMSKRFNPANWQGQYVFDSELGVGLEFRDPDKRVSASTLISTIIKNKLKRDGYAEEMRVLYVALTRAEQKLFLVGNTTTQDKTFEKWDKGNLSNKDTLLAHLRLTTNNYMDWIGSALARHQHLANDINSRQENVKIANYPVDFIVNFYNEAQILETLHSVTLTNNEEWLEGLLNDNEKAAVDADITEAVQAALAQMNYKYKYTVSTETTNYQSVSEVKQLFDEPDDGKLVKINLSEREQTHRFTEELLNRPKFLQETTAPTPSEIGQATHLLLQSIELDVAPTTESISLLLEQLVTEQIINEQTAKLIEIDKIVNFFTTAFGQEIVNNNASLKKETLFSYMLKASDIFEEMEGIDDSILIHGIIDGFYEQEDGLVLFDYKSDRVHYLGQNAREELLNRYKGQLLLYKQALETITKKEVKEVNIISLDLGETITIN